MSFRLARCIFALASIASASLVGCASDTPPGNRQILSDLDQDGLFESGACSGSDPGSGLPPDDGTTGDDPTGDEPGGGPTGDDPTSDEPGGDDPTGDGPTPTDPTDDCVIVPGPGGCVYAEVGADGCVYCLDDDGEPTGDSVCDTPVVSCEVTEERDDGTICWTCGEGDDAYTECSIPPVICETDADCAEGERCELPPPFECPGEQVCPDIAPIAVCVANGPREQ